MSGRPQNLTVSYVRRHRSLKSQKHALSVKSKRSTNVIHVSLHSQNNQSFNSNDKLSMSSVTYKSKNPSTIENSRYTLSNTPSTLVSHNTWDNDDVSRYSTNKEKHMNNQQKSNHKKDLNIQMDQISSIQDHHRKKTKKKNNKRRCILFCICLLVVVLVIAITTTLAILLTKNSTTTSVPSTVVSLRWNSSGITIAGKAGVYGANSTLLRAPYGLAFDSSKTLYIADYVNNRIQKLLTDTSICVTVAGSANGTTGTAMDRLSLPVGILFDLNDNMYIADRGNNRIQFWTKGATSGTTVAGINGAVNISFLGPSAIVNDSSTGTIYISDTYNHRIINYPAGIVVAGGHNAGNNDTQLYNPFGLVYDAISQSFIIPNYDTNNIVRWTLGATRRSHMYGNINGTAGSTATSLNHPIGLTMDPMGNIYVADSTNHRIQLFLDGQSSATTIAGTTGVSGINSTQLYLPYWVALDSQLNLYVSDTYNHRVQKFLRY